MVVAITVPPLSSRRTVTPGTPASPASCTLLRVVSYQTVSPKEAGIWTGVWITISLVFFAGLIPFKGSGPATQWLTAYVVEYALSVDNLFVFLMVFGYFRVAKEHQHRVLFWGILGAFVMRAVLIITGTALVARFHWLIYLFGAFLLFTAYKLFRSHGENIHREIFEIAPAGSPMYRSMAWYDRLRYRLMPYIYTVAADSYWRDGTIMRGLVMDFPADRKSWDVNDEYLFGPAFLVAPVTEYKARSRAVYLPAGADWYDFYTGKLAKGAPADLVLCDLNAPIVVDLDKLKSKSRNSPFDGRRLFGEVLMTLVDGRVVYRA